MTHSWSPSCVRVLEDSPRPLNPTQQGGGVRGFGAATRRGMASEVDAVAGERRSMNLVGAVNDALRIALEVLPADTT